MKSSSTPLLALDTSTRTVGLAIYDGARVIYETVWESRDHHTVEIAPAVDSALINARIIAADLGAIGVALGPGSFTSLRIGLALAKGIAMARQIPIVGVPSLDVLAEAQPVQDLPIAAVLRAGRGRLAVSWYQIKGGKRRLAGDIEVLETEELVDRIKKPTLICGELSPEQRQMLSRERKNITLAPPTNSLRRPSFLAELAWKRWQAGDVDDPALLSPIYLHYKQPIPE